MIAVLLLINAVLFILLALLHFYWAIGGRWALRKAVPTNSNGRPIFRLRAFGTAIVGAGLILFAWADLASLGWLELIIDGKYIRYGLWGIAAIFLLRAIGDFRYFGLAKMRQQSSFAKRDNALYTPISLFIGLSHAIIGMLY